MVALATTLRSVARPKQLAISTCIRVEVVRNTFDVMNEVFVGRDQQCIQLKRVRHVCVKHFHEQQVIASVVIGTIAR